MVYTPQTWTDGVSVANAARLNTIEAGIEDAHAELADKAGTGHTHTAATISGALALANMAPGGAFGIYWATVNSVTGWRYPGITGPIITARPTARTDLTMNAYGSETRPPFEIAGDLHHKQVP